MSARSPRLRADLLLVEQGLAETRTKAQALIMSGSVFLGDERIEKAGMQLPADSVLELRGVQKYVSRGGGKLEGALKALNVSLKDAIVADVGASTGGFTDCALQNGAVRVYAIDVGSNLLAHRLQQDERVVVMDACNARHLKAGSLDPAPNWVVVDASFIGIEKLLGGISRVLTMNGHLLAMIKPQFQLGKEMAKKTRGVVKDPALRQSVIDLALAEVEAHGFEVLGGADSEVHGPKGNIEYFVLARKIAEAPKAQSHAADAADADDEADIDSSLED